MTRKSLLLLLLLSAAVVAAGQTPCDSITMPWHEDFEGYGSGVEVMPSCWVASRNYDMGYPPHLVAAPRHNGTAALVLYPGTIAESHYSIAIAPPLAADEPLEGLHLRFYLYSASTATRLLVGFCADTGRYTRAFVPFDTLHVEQGSRWQEMIVDLSAYSGSGRRLAFRMERGLQPDNTEMYIDDVRIERCGTSVLTVSHVGSSQLTLHFDTYGLGVVEVAYGGDTIRPALSPITVTGLTPDSLYTFSVGCVGGDHRSIAVRTEEAASMRLAYYESFDASGGVLLLRPTADSSCVAVLPQPVGATLGELTMALRATATGTARLVVGAVEFPRETGDFVAIDTVDLSQGGTAVVSLHDYVGAGQYPALQAVGDGTVAVDEVRLGHCLLKGLHTYNLAVDAVTLAWDTLSMVPGATVNVEYGLAGFSVGTGTRLTATQCPMTLDGLYNDTPYEVYVWPSCGDAPAACDKASFRTFAHEMAPPYCTGFEGSAGLPQGWVPGPGASLGGNAYDGRKALSLTAGGTATMPLLGATTPDSCYLEFYGYGSGSLYVGRRTNPYAPVTYTDTMQGESRWRRYVVPISDARGYCLAFSASAAWSLDLLTLHEEALDEAAVSAISQTSAHLTWSMLSGDSVLVEYAALGSNASDFTAGTGTRVTAADSLTLTGLQPNRRYAVHLSAADGDGNASCSRLTLLFTTLAAPLEVPFCQNFDATAVGGYPAGWRRLSAAGEYPIVSTQRNLTGGRSLLFVARSGKSTVAILPDADGCPPSRTVAFWANSTTGYGAARLMTGYVSDVTDTAGFVAVDTMTFAQSDRWVHRMVHLDSLPGHLAMKLVSTGGTVNTFIENLCVEPCVAYNVRVTQLDSTGATLAWDADDSAALICHISRSGFSRTDTLWSSPATIGGLDNNSEYTIYVEALCPCGINGAAYLRGTGNAGTVTQNNSNTLHLYTRARRYDIPYCTTFDNYNTGSTPHQWRMRNGGSVSDRNSYEGGHSLQLTGGSTVSIAPLSNLDNAVVSFQLYGMHESLLSDTAIVVGVMSDPDSLNTFEAVDTLRLTALGVWQHLLADLSGYQGQGHYITLRTPQNSGALYMDNLTVAHCGISDLAASDGSTISWHTWHGVDSVAVEYGPAGFAPGDSGTVRQTVACTAPDGHESHTLGGLAEGVSYDIYVTPLCDSNVACQRLKTAIGAVTTTPYCEDMEAAAPAGIPFGWTACRPNNGTPTMATVGGSQVLRLQATAGSPAIAALPPLAVSDIESHQLTLRLRSDNHNRARLVVGQVADPTDHNTFVAHDTLTVESSGEWHTLRLPLARFSGPSCIALRAEATVQTATLWVDDLAVTRGYTPAVSVLSARSLLLENSDTDYYIDYGIVGTPRGDGTLLHVSGTSHVIGELQPEQSYRLYSSHDGDSNCLPPLVVTMPNEEALPYCHGRDTVTLLTLPEFDIDSLAKLHLYFRLHGGAAMAVGVLERRGMWETFVAVDTVTAPAGSWADKHVSLSTYGDGGRFVALRAVGGASAIIDSLLVTPCELPTVSLSPDNRATIEGTGAVEYGPAGFTQGSGTRVVTPATVTLDNNRSYDFYPLCDSDFVTCGAPQRLTTAIDRCPLPDSLLVAQPGNSRVELSWDTAYSGFWIEYMLAGGAPGSGVTQQVTVPPLTLTLDPDTTYDIYLRCDSIELTDRAPQQVATLASLVELPYCEPFEESLAGWRMLKDNSANYASVTADNPHSGLTSLKVRNYQGTTYLVLPQPDTDSLRRLAVSFYANGNGRITLGTMSDAGDVQTFDSLAVFGNLQGQYSRCFLDLANYYGNGHFLALRFADDGITYIDDLQVTTCAAYDFRMTAMEGDHVAFEWQQTGTPEVCITYKPVDSDDTITVHPTASPYHIEGLSPLTNYIFYTSYRCLWVCDSLAVAADTFYTFTPQGGTGCIDYTDLHASYVTCSYGSYDNPMENIGFVDNGYFSPMSRHTVHFDTAERDARSGGLLRTIPQGEPASIRLGNWSSGGNAAPEAESITYGMTVDADVADLLVLRYAAVLQDPEHSPSLQPRFRLEILNPEGRPIDSCSVADFIANAALGWNQAPNEVLWKDWTTVGIDLSPYNGQTIFVRLTTRDCGEGSHFGYAYFTLRCGSRRMQTEGCSVVPNNRFTVPTGFNYCWYTSADSTTTISDSASIWVRSDNSITYYCRLSFIDNPQCHFTMSAFAGARYPLALFDTALTVANCQYDLHLTNRSTISGDGVTPVGSGEPVETFRWLLPDSTESSASTPTVHLTDTGTVDITLIAGIADNRCVDTLRRSIVVRRPYPDATLVGRSERCRNDAADRVTVLHASGYGWHGGAFGSPATIDSNDVTLSGYVSADTTLVCYTVDSNGCRDTLRHTITVHPTYLRHYYDSVCSSDGSYRWLDTTVSFAHTASTLQARLDRHDRYGCDSAMTLRLHLWPSYYPTPRDTICDNGELAYFDTVLTTAGTYLHSDSTTHGCDSLVNLTLTVMPTYEQQVSLETCDSLRWIDGRLYTADTAGVTDTLTTGFGCDSVVILRLMVHNSYYSVYTDTFCASTPYYFRGMICTEGGLYSDTLQSIHNCDSVLAVELTRLEIPMLSTETLYNCREGNYTLVAHSTAPYLLWSSNGYDSIPDSSAASITVAPEITTTYTLYTDYEETPRCPATTTVRLSPFVKPVAEMRVTPQMLSQEHLAFEARDISESTWAERSWYIDGVLQNTTDRVIYSNAAPDADSCSVWLIVYDGHCYDTAIALLPVQRSDLAMPNIFTPDAETNNRFIVYVHNIAGYEINIYNRRGMLVYHSTDINAGWDGRDMHGVPCPPGSYVYHLRYSTVFRPTAFQKAIGSVMLIR